MPKSETVWYCTKCGKKFTTDDDAAECEESHGVATGVVRSVFVEGDKLAPIQICVEFKRKHGDSEYFTYTRDLKGGEHIK